MVERDGELNSSCPSRKAVDIEGLIAAVVVVVVVVVVVAAAGNIPPVLVSGGKAPFVRIQYTVHQYVWPVRISSTRGFGGSDTECVCHAAATALALLVTQYLAAGVQ